MYRAYPIPYKCVLSWQQIVDILTDLPDSFAAYFIRIIYCYNEAILSGNTKNTLIQRRLKGKLHNLMFYGGKASIDCHIWMRIVHLEDFNLDNKILNKDADTFIGLAVFWSH